MSVVALMTALALGFGTPQPIQTQEGTTLPEVEVTGRPTAEAVRDFVGRIAAPAQGRGLAQWRNRMCPGVANLSREAAQAIVDRITDVANDLGVETGEPGCEPNLVVIFTEDGRGLAQAMVERDKEIFHQNVSGLDRGTAALRDFQTAERPVRWWSLSLPVDADTGQRAVRVPGDFAGNVDTRTANAVGCVPEDCALAFAPILQIRGPSRLRTQIIDKIYKTIIIVDVDQVGGRTTAELGDYLAFVGLAQVDPEADTVGFDTVLNLFDGSSQGLTEWDRSYLQALYAPSDQRVSPGAQATAVAEIMTRDRRANAR